MSPLVDSDTEREKGEEKMQEQEEDGGDPDPQLEKRKKKPVNRFDPLLGGGGNRKKPKLTKPEQEVKPEVKAENGAILITPRTGKPFIKGICLSGGLGSWQPRQPHNPKPEGQLISNVIDLTKEHKGELSALQAKLEEKDKEILRLSQLLSEESGQFKLLKAVAKDAVSHAHTEGKLKAVHEAQRHFQLGLQAGVALNRVTPSS